MPDSKLFKGSGPIKLSQTAATERIKDPMKSETTEPGMAASPAPAAHPQQQSNVPTKQQEYQQGPVTPSVSSFSAQPSSPSIPPAIGYTPTMPTMQVKPVVPSGHQSPLEANISTSWSPARIAPRVEANAFIHPRGLVIGNVEIRSGVFVAPFAAIRGDEDEPIYIGEESAILEGAIINALPTRRDGEKLAQRLIRVDVYEYPVYIAQRVTISQSVNIHGPAFIGSNTYIGMGALIFWAKIGSNCVIEPGALIINVEIPDGRFVPAGLSVTSQKIVSTLPMITDRYRFARINDEMLAENREILNGYLNR